MAKAVQYVFFKLDYILGYLGYGRCILGIPAFFASVCVLTFIICLFSKKLRKKNKSWCVLMNFLCYLITILVCLSEYGNESLYFDAFEQPIMFATAVYAVLTILYGGLLLESKIATKNISEKDKELIARLLKREAGENNKAVDITPQIFKPEMRIESPFDNVSFLPTAKLYERNIPVNIPPRQSGYVNVEHVRAILDKLKRCDLTDTEQKDTEYLESLCAKYLCRMPTDTERSEFNTYLLTLVKKMAKYNIG